MNREVCLIMTPKLMELYKELQKNYPEECKASNVNAMVMLGWVENYQKDFDKTPDFTPDLKSLIPYVESLRNREGKSFLNKEVAQKSEANPILVQFIKDIETLAGYYEGGGRVLSDDVPNFPNELDDKLNDHFMGGEELTLDDYKKLWKVLEFKDGKVYGKQANLLNSNESDTITYTPIGKKEQIYTIKGNHIYNKKGKEVFTSDSKNRRKIFANLAVKQKRAVIVDYKDKQYVVNDRQQIISVSTGDLMKWPEYNGDRKNILALSVNKFYKLNSKSTSAQDKQTKFEENPQIGNSSNKQDIVIQLINQLKASGINVLGRADMEKYLTEKGKLDPVYTLQAIKENQEMQDIKAKALANGTFMKAPNGKPTNLTERQWLQVRTKAFKEWFGDWENDPENASKVVDENGEPLVVYHGTDNTFTVFDPTKQDGEHEAFYFTDSQEMAKSYKGGTVLMPLFLNVRDSYEVDAKGGNWNNIELDLASKAKTPVEFAELILKQQQVEIETAKRGYYDDFWGKFVKDEKYINEKIKSITERYLPKLYKRYLELQDEHSNNPIKNIKRILEMRSIMKTISNIYKDAYSRNSYCKSQERVSTRDLDLVLNDKEGIIIQNVKDYGSKVEKPLPHNVYVVYQPNQIKSATDNNGMFSTENDNIQMFIGKKARTQFEQQLRKARPDMSNDEIKATLDFLHSLEDNKENTAYIKAAIRWIANKSLTLPQDHTKAHQVFELARKKHIDLQKYNTLGELIASPEMQPKEKEKVKFNPDEAKTFSNKRTVTTKGGRVFTVYDVENTEEGQREVCKALAAYYETSPWCLSTFTSKGEPTQSAKKYWNEYSGIPRKIAFENDKPVAFSSKKSESLGGWHTLDGIQVYVVGEFMPTGEMVTSIDKDTISEEKREEWVKKGYIYPNLIYARSYQLTDKGIEAFEKQKQEAWWDMEDTHPQDSLSDSIVSDYRTSEQREQAIAEARIRAFQEQYEEYVRTGFPEPINPFQEEEEIDDLPFFLTPEGEVYGFVDKEGNIYLDETVISPEHPIHEYTHLWDRALWTRNPRLWKRGVELMKNSKFALPGETQSIWESIENKENYGKAWKAAGIKGENLERLIASEVHARLVGEGGLQLLEEVAKKKGSKGIVAKLKQWILDTWKELKATFGNWSQDEIDKLTLTDFNHMAVRDLFDGVRLQEMETSLGTTTTPAMEKTLNSLRNYYKWKKNHVEFKTDTHEYLLDGVPVDYSVTQYGEKIFGKPNIQGDYSHSTAMGNDVDELTRDFFASKDVEGNTYKNLNDVRKHQIISDLKRFQKYLDGRFKNGYRVITTPLELIAKMADNAKEVTVAGTPDMLVIDSKGDVYMVDMKVKNHPITKTYNGKEVNDRRNYTFQQNGYRQIIEAIFPELRGRIKELNLLWFDTSYPRQGREAKFETSKTGVVTVTDPEEGQVLLSEYPKWATPSLKENVEESVIPLENNKDVLPGVQPLDSYSDIVETSQSSLPSAGQSLINRAIQKHQGNWSRQEAQNNPRILYVFTDNTDRDSGHGLIPDDSWYSKKYGTGHHFPTMTAAVVRGLDNSRPISTQRWYHQGAKGTTGRWTDADVEEFKKVIREELQEIVKEYNTGKYDTIMFPDGDGLFNTRISNITKARTPKLYQTLADLLHEYGFDSLIPADVNPTQSTQQQRGLSSLESNAVDLNVNDKDLEIAKETVKMEKQKVTKPESESLKSSLQVKEDRFTKFKQTLSPQQINDAGVRMAVLFTEKLNILVAKELERLQEMQEDDSLSEKDKEVVRERLITIQDPIKGRQEVATSYGIANLLDDVKESMEKVNPYGYKEHPERLIARDNVLEYFNEIFNAKASQEIELVEGIQIIDLETKEDEENKDVLDTDDDTDNVATGSDGWSFKMRLQNPAESLSSKVRLMLSGIEKGDALDSLGYTAYYPVGQVYATCLSYISRNLKDADDFMQIRKSWDELQEEGGSSVFFATGWMESKEDFESTYPYGAPVFPILEKMKERYPRIAEEMIIRLTNDFAYPREVDPNNPRPTFGSLASQFYAGFKLAMIPYGKIKLGGEAFGITPLNYEMSDRIMYDKLVANYNNRIALTDECIYNSDGSINIENLKSLWGGIHRDLDTSEEYVNTPILNEDNWEEQEYTKEEYEDYKLHIQHTTHDLRSLGIDITEDDIKGYIASGEITTLLENAEKVVDNLTRLKDNDELKEGFDYILDTRDTHKRKLWKDFFNGIGTINSDHYLQSYYDPATGKTKYSYSADNYLMKIFRGIAMGTLEERRQFIDEHFGNYEWFKNQKTGEWKNAWLEYYYNQTKVVGSNGEEIPNFNYPYKNIDNVTYPDGKVSTYTKWTNEDIWYVQHRSYDYKKTRARGGDPYGEGSDAYYLTPIFSDSPMSMTVLGPKFSLDVLLNNKDKFTDTWDWAKKSPFIDLVLQEVQRIQNVANRKKHIKEGTILPISNYDGKRGLKFCFLPELNNYYFDEGDSFLDRMASMKDNTSTEEIENTIMRAVTDILENRFYEYLNINKKVITDNGFNLEDAEDMYKLRKEFYNSVYANAAIIQLTTVDLAFYKNEVDFQKRFKEVYAGGTQLNTSSRYGKKTENVAIISDDIITSPSYKDIAEIIDNSNRLSQEDKNYIKGIFKEVNVGDAQAIRSMHSFRSVLDMLGDWDNNRMEEALTHFKQGSWHREDFDVIYQTIKPFMFTIIDKNNGDGTSIAVPQQHKNSEICALMMYNLINESYAGSQSPVYQALSEFMDETVDASGNKLVDMIQFESAVKTGNQGVVNISFNPNKVMSVIEEGVIAKGVDLVFETANEGKTPNDIEHSSDNFKAIKKQADEYLENGKLSQEDYDTLIAYLRPTKEEIKEILTKNLIQTNSDGTKTINPERVHTIPFSNYYKQQPTPEHHIDAKAVDGSQARNIIVADLPKDFKLEVPCKGGTKVFEGRDALIDFYYELLNENLIEDFFGKGSKKGLKGLFSSKKELKEAIKQIVRGNPKYSDDFLEALDTNDDGSFKLSPNSPTMFNQMQDIITSFFKNRINKQSINGAALIQAAGIGFDDSLRLRFEDGRLIGIECYMPLTSKDLFEPLLVEREIDGKIVKVLDPEKLEKLGLDKAVGYRIPTENKSSIAPLIIKGFTSPQNGSAIMLPAEITALSGSDFDVDKMFIMLLAFNVITHDMKKAFYDYARSEHEKAQEMINALGKANIEDLDVDEIGQNFKDWFEKHKDEYVLEKPIIKKVQYDFSKSPKENGRKARNNMLIQIRYGILTSKECADLVLNPQGFKDVKRAAKISQIVNNPTLFASFLYSKYTEDLDNTDTDAFMDNAIKKLLKLSTPQLKKFIQDNSISDSPIYPQTFTKSHARNMAGSNQIGIYAIQGSMCAKQQRATITLRPQQQFTINGKLIKNVDVSDEGRRMRNTNQMVGASADNGKDPNLTDMGSTSKTAPIIGLMLREGLSHLEASLLINQPCMKLCNYNSKNKNWYKLLPKNKYMQTMPVDTVTLIKNIVDPDSLDTLEKTNIDLICYHILQQHEGMEFIDKVSRADSPNGALGNSYAKGRVQRYKVDVLQAMMGQDEYPFNKVTETLSNTAVDTSASENTVREQLKKQKMGLLHGMYALGINSFDTLMKNYFFGAQKWFDERIVKPILYSLPVDTPEEALATIVNSIYKSYMIYKLSSSPLFGDEENTTVEQKKKYYNESFPDDFVTILHENEDIQKLLGDVLQVSSVTGKKRIILQNNGVSSSTQKQAVKDRLESLIYSSNPKAHELAVQLLLYSYFVDGLQYNRYSFSTYFSSKYLMSIPMYSEACNHFDEEMSDKDCLNFVMQFLNTYPSAATKMDKALKESDITIKADTLIVSNYANYRVFKSVVNPLLSPNPKKEVNLYPYISYNDILYVLDKEALKNDPSHPTYYKLPRYNSNHFTPFFTSQRSIEELAESMPINSSSNETQYDEDFFVDDILSDSNDLEITGFSDNFDTADPSELYAREGENELQDKFC